ncbi:MAG: acyclic terpene utilization AtuA family protein, partial [Betaproteobacteria bacterium]|nr:acyclic terpene utilization AtuA family protein [Betaproteobacteria bacterium]
MSTSSLACRVGSGAGFAGDRIDPAVRLVQSGEIDTIALECLAERT